MTFTITLLGTATDYTPNDAPDAGYPRGETLSVVSTMIAGPVSEDRRSAVVQYASEHAQVIQGPDNLGYEVGNRIAHAVLAILEKMAQGETQFNLMAHSRGAVEAILVAHELERIQFLFNEKGSITLDDLANSPDVNLTQAAMKTVLAVFSEQLSKSPDIVEQIQTGFQRVKLAIFNIDPVPGGRWQGVPTRWVDDRFYVVPSIVNEYIECVYEHERSRAFKAIIPKHSEATKYELFTLPGHHGTGSGNFIDQQLAEKTNPALGEGKTSHVQELMIVKLLQFLDRNGVKAFDLSKIESLQLNAALGQVFRAVIDETSCNASQLEEKACALYIEIQKNKSSYEHFKNTTYVTGKEQAWKAAGDSLAYALSLGLVSRDTTHDDRFVHFHQHSSVGGDVFLGDVIDQSVNRQYYVNHDHAELSFRQVYTAFGMSKDLTIVDQVDEMRRGLLKICNYLHQQEYPDPASVTDSYRGLSPTTRHFLEFAQQGADIYERCAEFFIGEMSQAYLSGRISIEDRPKLLEQIKAFFNTFQTQLDKPDDEFKGRGRELANTILEQFKQGLTRTVQQKNKALVQEISSIENQLFQRNSDVARHFVTQLQGMYDELKSLIGSMQPVDDSSSLVLQQRDLVWVYIGKINQVLTKQVDLSPHVLNELLEEFIRRYSENLERFSQKAHDLSYQESHGQIMRLIFEVSECANDALNAVKNKEVKLSAFVVLYQDLDHYLSSMSGDLQSLVSFSGDEGNTIRLLLSKKEALPHVIAKFIYENQLDLDAGGLWRKSFDKTPELMAEVDRRVNEMKAADPRIAFHQRDFEQYLQEKQSEIETLESEMKTVSSALSDGLKKIESIDQLIVEKTADFEKAMQMKQGEIEKLVFEHHTEMLVLDMQTRADLLEKRDREIAEIVEHFESKVAYQQQRIDSLSEQRDILQSTIEFNDMLLAEKEEKIGAFKKIWDESFDTINYLMRMSDGLSKELELLKSQHKDILDHNFRVRDELKEKSYQMGKMRIEFERYRKRAGAAKAQLNDENAQLKGENAQLKINNTEFESIIAAQQEGLIGLETEIIRLQRSVDEIHRPVESKNTQTDLFNADLEALQAENSALRQAAAAAAEKAKELESERLSEVQTLQQLIQANEETIDKQQIQATAREAEIQAFNQTRLMLQTALVEAHAPNELICQALVNDHLIPLTTDYLRHLLKEQRKTVEGSVQRDAVDEKIQIIEALQTQLDRVNAPADQGYPDRNQRCVRDYYNQLDLAHESLATHRDPRWMRYVANTVKVLSIVLTGILPGLLVLGIVSAFTGKSNQFWVSHGATFFGRAQEAKPSDHWIAPTRVAAAN